MSYKTKKLEKLLGEAGYNYSSCFYGFGNDYNDFGWHIFNHQTANSKFIGKNIGQAIEFLDYKIEVIKEFNRSIQ